MSVFDRTALFLRDPHAGVESISEMAAAGFGAVYCNVGDFAATDWEAVIRPRALNAGMDCLPWLRTQGADGKFSPLRLQSLIAIADLWQSGLVVNCEKELDGTGGAATQTIARMVGTRQAALSTEATPFSQTDWGPVAGLPVAPQLNVESGHTDVNAVAPLWRAWGFRCVYPTFGTYGGRQPNNYRLQSPYSLYTADDCHGDYQAWRPTSSGYQACTQTPKPPEDEMAGVRTEVDEAWDMLEQSSVPASWRRDNPGEYNAIKNYYVSRTATTPTNISTKFGKGLLALVDAGKYGDGTHP